MNQIHNSIDDRLRTLRAEMVQAGIDIYIVPTADDHESEYVGEYYACRKYITGFTGSAGVALITMDEAGLWTDGRYFIQAQRQLAASSVRLFKMGQPEVPTLVQYVETLLSGRKGAVLGFCGTSMNQAQYGKYEQLCIKYGCTINMDVDLIGNIWTDRPKRAAEPIFVLDEKYTGCSTRQKLMQIRKIMEENGAHYHLIGAMDDSCYLLNARGNDAGEFKIFLNFLLIGQDFAKVYVQKESVDAAFNQAMAAAEVEILDYEQIYQDVQTLPAGKIMLDTSSVNSALYHRIAPQVEKIQMANPSMMMKAVKNETELANIRAAHLKDGVAMVEFIYWLKHEIGTTPMTEWTASQYIDHCRAKQEGFIDLSFDTISAYNSNAAMMHYCAGEDDAALLQPEGLLLVDSGGHYLEGTTDITRTIALGPVPQEWKKHYTLTLKGMLQLADARFMEGCSGLNLDILARGPLWHEGIDYKCGTGHGVGYVLSVHEGPNGFRYRHVPERNDGCALAEGMVTTDEPGVYIEGSHGIRIENELVCHKSIKNDNGQFMEFEHITFVPIDTEAIDLAYMDPYTLKLLNLYHQAVYDHIGPLITTQAVKQWLYQVTRPIG